MGRIIILGSASAVPDERQENSHMIVLTERQGVLIDCPGNPTVRLKQASVPYEAITDIILTHFHPDHVSGFALLVMDLWLLGRKPDLHVWGLAATIERAQQMMDLYTWHEWPNVYPVHFHALPEEELHLFLTGPDLRISSSPSKHLVPTMGVRIEFLAEGRVVTYSSDTEPSDAIVRLAQDADILIHEATSASIGHSSAEQAGQIATRAGVKSLYLIHYLERTQGNELIPCAERTFSGPVALCKDFLTIPVE
jgi:ribonuclease Z